MVGEAFAKLEPANLQMGEGRTTFAVNRRNNPEAEVPAMLAAGKPLAGPVDHDVPVLAIVDAVGPTTHPSVDVGLAALVAALGAPPAAASGLFALARSAGWLAHALEQRAAGFMLRPRARYTGVPVA